MSDLDDLFPSAAAEWQLPEGIRLVTLVEDAEELTDRISAAGLSTQLEWALAKAQKSSRLHQAYSAATVLIAGNRAYGISVVQYADEESPRLDMAIFEFAEHWRAMISDYVGELLLDRGEAFWRDGSQDDEEPIGWIRKT
jgi:hypothetical protein